MNLFSRKLVITIAATSTFIAASAVSAHAQRHAPAKGGLHGSIAVRRPHSSSFFRVPAPVFVRPVVVRPRLTFGFAFGLRGGFSSFGPRYGYYGGYPMSAYGAYGYAPFPNGANGASPYGPYAPTPSSSYGAGTNAGG